MMLYVCFHHENQSDCHHFVFRRPVSVVSLVVLLSVARSLTHARQHVHVHVPAARVRQAAGRAKAALVAGAVIFSASSPRSLSHQHLHHPPPPPPREGRTRRAAGMYISSAGAAGAPASKAPSSEPRELARVDSKAIKVESGRRLCGPRARWEDFFVFRINRLVGWKFVVATALLYGLDQGGVESLVGLPQVYFYKNRGLSPAETTRVMTYAGLSWSIKPLFGLIMDGFPILRYHFRCVGMRPIRACTAAARRSSAGSGRSLTDSLARSLSHALAREGPT